MFQLPMTNAKIVSYNARAETHGDRQVPAADLHLELTLPNDVLAHFGKGLRESLFTKSAPVIARPKPQGELDVGAPMSEYAHVKNPALAGPFSLEFEGVGYRLSIDYGAGPPTIIGDCKVRDIKVDLLDGVGAVAMRLRVSKSDISEHDRGLLSGMVKCSTRIQLDPPDAGQGAIK